MKKTKTKGLFPGSFDPFTKGHQDIVEQALQLFDEVIVGIGVNTSKHYMFDIEKRKKHIESLFHLSGSVSVVDFSGLTVDFAKENEVDFLIRGLRDSRDFSYERSIAHMNEKISGIKSVFFLTKVEFGAINSTIVREILKNGGKVDEFVTNIHLLA